MATERKNWIEILEMKRDSDMREVAAQNARERGETFWEEPLRAGMNDGWITPDGKIYVCRFDQHDLCAEWIVRRQYPGQQDSNKWRNVLFLNGFAQLSRGEVRLGKNKLTSRQQAVTMACNFPLPYDEAHTEPVDAILPKIFTYVKDTYPDLERQYPTLFSYIKELFSVTDGEFNGKLTIYQEANKPLFEQACRVYADVCFLLNSKTLFVQRPDMYAKDEIHIAQIWTTAMKKRLFLTQKFHMHSDRDQARGVDLTLQVMDMNLLKNKHPSILHAISDKLNI